MAGNHQVLAGTLKGPSPSPATVGAEAHGHPTTRSITPTSWPSGKVGIIFLLLVKVDPKFMVKNQRSSKRMQHRKGTIPVKPLAPIMTVFRTTLDMAVSKRKTIPERNLRTSKCPLSYLHGVWGPEPWVLQRVKGKPAPKLQTKPPTRRKLTLYPGL